MRMASEGGYEAVQMRAVAEESGVALGTIYRYYSGKDDAHRRPRRLAATHPSPGRVGALAGDTPGDRLIFLLEVPLRLPKTGPR